jgi:hypothetical protein
MSELSDFEKAMNVTQIYISTYPKFITHDHNTDRFYIQTKKGKKLLPESSQLVKSLRNTKNLKPINL